MKYNDRDKTVEKHGKEAEDQANGTKRINTRLRHNRLIGRVRIVHGIKNEVLSAKLPEAVEKMNADISNPPNKLNVRMW